MHACDSRVTVEVLLHAVEADLQHIPAVLQGSLAYTYVRSRPTPAKMQNPTKKTYSYTLIIMSQKSKIVY